MNSFSDIVEEIKSIISVDFEYKKVFDKDVANVLGISQMNFATMKRRDRLPFNELLDFCAKRNISINWLLYGQSPESLVEATNNYMIKYLNDINVSAGGGSENEVEEVKDIEIPSQFISILGGEQELNNIEAIRVSGDSMEPTFYYDDIVFINRMKKDLNRGGVFVIRTDAGLFIKRILKKIDGKVDVISDNSVYPQQTLNIYELEVIGRVICRYGEVN